MSEEYLFADLTGEIIGAAIEVHKAFGPGFLEKVYENAMCIELAERALSFQQQVPFVIRYRDRAVGEYIADLIVEDKVVVEVKAASQITATHKSQVVNYLACSGLRVGLVLNFGEPTLKPARVVR